MADTRYEHQIEVMQQGYDQLSEDMQKALDDSIKLINGDQKELINVAGFMLDQLRTNEVDEKAIIDGIVEGVGTKIHDETQSQFDDTLTQNDSDELKLLTNLLTGEGGASALVDIQRAIDNQGIIEAVENIDPVVNITMNSDNKDIKEILKQIADKYLELDSEEGTTGGTAHQKNISDAQGNLTQAYETQQKITKGETELSSLQASLKERENRLVELQKKHEAYNDKINDLKQDRKQAQKIKDDSERVSKSMQILDKIDDLKGKRDDIVEKEKKVSNDIQKAQADYTAKENELKKLREQYERLMEEMKNQGYRSGSKKIKKDELAWTNENYKNIGPEMIVRKSDGAILTPLKANDSVIPANLAENLFKWGAISPDKFLSNPFLGKMGDMPNNATVNNSVDQNVELHFDSLFNIQGDVTSDVMDRLEDLGKALTSNRNFQQNVVKFVTKDFVRESKKQGGFR